MDLPFLLTFLRNLAANNNKVWMDANRADYHRARATFTALIQEVLHGLQRFDPDLQGVTPSDSMFRINKNDRFQQSNEPYKKRMGAGMSRGGRHSPWAGYFLAVEPQGQTWIGAGKWRPEPLGLARIRQEIQYNSAEFHQLRQEKAMLRHFPNGFEGERLQRPPKGYDKNDPDIEWIKLKDFFVSHSFTNAELLAPDFVSRAVASFQAAQPLVQFLNRALEGE
jgi:uncharacterized protein (TIGR02453 family)